MNPRAMAAALVIAAVAVTVTVGLVRRGSGEGARCGRGFVARAARCVAARTDACPAPLLPTGLGCDAPDVTVTIPETTIVLGPSDWEAEGRVTPRTVHAGPFRIDAFEVTRGRWSRSGDDAARAASGMTRDEAAAFCARQAPGGRLPTEDEWILAAVSGASAPPRYPWGDTGAVCRRAAWGLRVGPCSAEGDGPDTVGAHPDGDSPLGVHDLAGNVAEWVAPEGSSAGGPGHVGGPEDAGVKDGIARVGVVGGAGGIAKGGSWQTALASELRVWARLELDPGSHDARVGFRCVHPI